MPPRRLLSRQEYENFLRNLPEKCCPFCEYKNYQIVLKEWERWIWVVNLSPYWYHHTLLVPKHHLEEFSQLTTEELVELKKVTAFVIDKYRQKKLLLKDGTRVQKYVLFWRLRDNRYDSISGNMRPDHFHIQIAPDKDHLWDPITDSTANHFDFREFLK